MHQFQESIRPYKNIVASLLTDWELWWLVQEYHESDCDIFGNTSELWRELWVRLGIPATSLRAPATSLRAYGTSLGAPMTSQGLSVTSLGVCQITVEYFRKNNILFGNIDGTSRNHSNYLSFNNILTSCIQFVFSYMYLCIYIATHVHTVYLDCGCRRWLREIKGVPDNDDRVSSEIHCKCMIYRVWGCTWRPWSILSGDTLRGCDRGSLQMHLEAVIECVWRYAHEGYDHANLEAGIKRV